MVGNAFGEVTERLRRSTVQVQASRISSGSGVIWNADGQIVNQTSSSETHYGKYGQSTTMIYTDEVSFEYGGKTYRVEIVTSSSQSGFVRMLFSAFDPYDAYIYDPYTFWMSGLLYVAIGFVPLAAASFSFINKNERLLLSFQKIGLIKTTSEYNPYKKS